jgi:hypothetical protein
MQTGSKNILFVSRNDIVKRTVIGGNIDPEKIIPFVKTAQDKYILIPLGTVLYSRLQEDVKNGTLTGQYKTLMDEYIVDCLVHYAMVESLPFLAYTFGNGSIVKMTDAEQGTSPSKNDIDFLLQKELQTAQFYAERLVNYLIAYSSIYPEYLATTGFSDNVFPDKGQQYRNGWVI